MIKSISLKYSIILNILLVVSFIGYVLYSSQFQNKSSVKKETACEKAISDMEFRECSLADKNKAEAEFEQLHKKVLASILPYIKDDYVQSDKNWRLYRQTQCVVEKNINAGGTMEPIAYNFCITHLTTDRIEQLKDLDIVMDSKK